MLASYCRFQHTDMPSTGIAASSTQAQLQKQEYGNFSDDGVDCYTDYQNVTMMLD